MNFTRLLTILFVFCVLSCHTTKTVKFYCQNGLRDIRIECNYTAIELANAAGINKETYLKVENCEVCLLSDSYAANKIKEKLSCEYEDGKFFIELN